MPNRWFPKADSEAAFEFYELGRAKLTRLSFLTAAELRQSIGLALHAHQTGIALHVLTARARNAGSHTHLCGPKFKRSPRKPPILVKKR